MTATRTGAAADHEAAAHREARYLVRPVSVLAPERLERLLLAGVDPRVARVDLELPKARLRGDKRWSRARADAGELEYKRMLTLLRWNPNLAYPIVPTRLADAIWHHHILDTRAYHADMLQVFGEYLHHFPYLGFRTPENVRLKLEAFQMSCVLYERTFGESVEASIARQLSRPRKRG